MFDYFLEEYILLVKKDRKRLNLFQIFILLFILASLFLLLLSVCIKIAWLTFISFGMIIVSEIIANVYINIIDRKSKREKAKNYVKNHINEVVILLKKDDFNMYSDDKLDWLINSSKSKIENNNVTVGINKIITFSNSIIIPTLLLCFSIILNKANAQEFFAVTIGLFFILFLLFISISSIGSVIYTILFPKKHYIELLIDDLEYIKVFKLNK